MAKREYVELLSISFYPVVRNRQTTYHFKFISRFQSKELKGELSKISAILTDCIKKATEEVNHDEKRNDSNIDDFKRGV